MDLPDVINASRSRRCLLVRGLVQGIGFRPYVWLLARTHGVGGFVRNDTGGALLEVEGFPAAIAAFEAAFRAQPPPMARIDSLQSHEMAPQGEWEFRIVPSTSLEAMSTPISPDMATCPRCLDEMADATNRRFGYPFINCTQCGPRFTIVESLPYDRSRTTMRRFQMCAACATEYADPADRRFHAQPNACWRCGPTLWLYGPGDVYAEDGAGCAQAHDAIARAQQLLDGGDILAVKGIGGFHLACDARNSAAVARLRERKGRAEKPFAVMAACLHEIHHFAEVSAKEAELLAGSESPIVLLGKRRNSDAELAQEVAPESPHWGVMLPYSPLHHLLLARPDGGTRILVMTSGNWSDEPIARENREAIERLAPLADGFLLHNRDIQVVADDSVVRAVRGRELPLRRSRGYAPMPVLLPEHAASVLAVGAEFKAAFCLTSGRYAYLSQHIGDVGQLETQQAFQRALDHFIRIFRLEPQRVACDQHPSYLSSEWARQYAAEHGLPLSRVQHHRAHVAALLAEHGIVDDEPFLGVAFDGTGYGDDAAIWGGEFLLARGRQMQREKHLSSVPLPGGDSAVRHPWRCALTHLRSAGLDSTEIAALLPGHERELPVLWQQLSSNYLCVPTSSIGRLFDAVAAVVGLRHSVTFEAQAAMQLESLCAGMPSAEPYPFHLPGDTSGVDVSPMWHALVQDRLRLVSPGLIAARFHSTVAEMVLRVCMQSRERTAVQRVGLTGGVFQNVRLAEETSRRLESAGFSCFQHRLVPPNDGGIALGQAWLSHREMSDI